MKNYLVKYNHGEEVVVENQLTREHVKNHLKRSLPNVKSIQNVSLKKG